MQEKSVAATLHHQIVYRIQDHALDLVLPSSDEALYLEVTSASQAPNSIQIPRQIFREELLRRLPESWLFTQFAIQIDERSFHGPAKEQNPKPSSFEKDGTVIYPFKDEDGHCYFDVCSCATCDEASYSYESDEDIRIRRRKKKDPLYKRYLEGDTSVGPLGEGKYDFIVQYSEEKDEPRQQIMMINPKDFPPQEEFLKNNVAYCPKILSQTMDSSGPSMLSQAEKVLNWQTENSLAQNQLLSTINHKVDQLAEEYNSRLISLQKSITDIHGRLGNLHQEMMTMAKQMMANTTQFRNKEAETTSLKYQLRDLQKCLESMVQNQQANAYFDPLGGTPSSIPMYQGSYSPGFLFGQQTQKNKIPSSELFVL
uniref:Uncharacterized protein n=1 Tax=Brassica campestris TaxID=3711 RepID=A0A3P5YVR2_BRACM|nr:unnamed protein product [Brassica rapa]